MSHAPEFVRKKCKICYVQIFLIMKSSNTPSKKVSLSNQTDLNCIDSLRFRFPSDPAILLRELKCCAEVSGIDWSSAVLGAWGIPWTMTRFDLQFSPRKYGNLFFEVYLNFAWLKTSKNSTSRVFSRKNFDHKASFSHFLDALTSCQMILRVGFGSKNNKQWLFLRMSIKQILAVTCDTPKKAKSVIWKNSFTNVQEMQENQILLENLPNTLRVVKCTKRVSKLRRTLEITLKLRTRIDQYDVIRAKCVWAYSQKVSQKLSFWTNFLFVWIFTDFSCLCNFCAYLVDKIFVSWKNQYFFGLSHFP